MNTMPKSPRVLAMLALVAAPATVSTAVFAQDVPDADVTATVYGEATPAAAEMSEGPEINGIISARTADKIQVTGSDGTKSVIAVTPETTIKSSGGFLGLSTDKLASDQLLNGLPVSVKTMQSGSYLAASQINLKSKDLKTASMIHNGTDQRFASNEAATEALRGRMGDIDQYNIKATTNVNFDTGKANLSPQAKADLCAAATQAQGMDNALLLVVGYTDSTGSEDFNQMLSEKRAGKVVNYLQQACGWKPYRMLSPTGMAEADPLADNTTPYGKAQNRRVAVNVMVSKAVDGL